MKLKRTLSLIIAMGLTVSGIPANMVKNVSAEDTLVGALFFDTDFEGFNTEYYVSKLKEFDKNNDGMLSVNEQLAVEELRLIEGTQTQDVINTPMVGDMPHIDAFKNLKKLFIHDFNVFGLDLTKNEKLEELSITKSIGTTDIKVSGLKNLKTVAIGMSFIGDIKNSFTNLDFSGCSALENVFFAYTPDLEKINFAGCTSLDAFYLVGPSNVKTLDFSDCTKLRYMYAEGNTSLKSIYVPSTFTEVNLASKWEEGKAQNGAALVSGFYYDIPCTLYFGKPGNEATLKKFTGDPKQIKIDKNGKVTHVGIKFVQKKISYEVISETSVQASYPTNKSKVKTVNIPDKVTYEGRTYKVTEIRETGFSYCPKLKKVTLGRNITKIGSQAFRNCKKLKTIVFKGTALKKIKRLAFTEGAKKIKVVAPKKVKKKYKKMVKKAGAKKVR